MRILPYLVLTAACLADPLPPGPPPEPPPAEPYRVLVILEKSSDLTEGFSAVTTNEVWTTKSSGFFRIRIEL
jgi:hypothetical protein